jgi:hypothetical protein
VITSRRVSSFATAEGRSGGSGACDLHGKGMTRQNLLLSNDLLRIAINAMIFQHEANCALSAAARNRRCGCGHGTSAGFGSGMHGRDDAFPGAFLRARLCDQFGGMAHVPGQSGSFGRCLFPDQHG